MKIVGNTFPVRLPTVGMNVPMENDAGRISGFGRQTEQGALTPSAFLQQGYKRVVANTRCSSFFNVDINMQFCAEDTTERSNICQGDQGGPFVMSYRRQDLLVSGNFYLSSFSSIFKLW